MAVDRVVELSEVRTALTEAGAGGRPLLLVHGFTGARTDFTDFLDDLADRGWHAVAPDLRGHGESGKPDAEDAYSFPRFAADLLELADALGWASFTLLGHSMGGMVAQELVATAPERVGALVLMDTSCGPIAIDPELRDLAVTVVRTEGMDVLADLQATIESPLTTPAYTRLLEERPGFRESEDAKLRTSSPAMYATMARVITEREPVCDRLAAVDVPTLVLVGEQDRPFVGPSETMAATIPRAELIVIADAGHSPQFEAPDDWWAALAGFLDDVAAGAAQEQIA